MNTKTDSQPSDPIEAQQGSGGDGVSRLVVPLRDALALVDFGACRDGDPAEWINVASPMRVHCIGTEDVNLAAARIIAAEYRIAVQMLRWAMPRLRAMAHDFDVGGIGWACAEQMDDHPEIFGHNSRDREPGGSAGSSCSGAGS